MGELRFLAGGREAEIFLRPDGTVLKLMRSSERAPALHHEAAALAAVSAAVSAAGVRVPAVVELVEVDGRPGLVMERVEGPNLLQVLSRRPYEVFRAGRQIARVHARLHDTIGPGTLPSLRPMLEHRIAGGSLQLSVRSQVLEVLAGLPDDDRLCHGDFHFGNLLGSFSDPVVIDWSAASRGDPLADVARTRLLLGLGAPGPDAPALVRVLAPVCRRGVVASYLRSYGRERRFAPASLDAWTLVQAAARLEESISEERPALLELVRRHLSA